MFPALVKIRVPLPDSVSPPFPLMTPVKVRGFCVAVLQRTVGAWTKVAPPALMVMGRPSVKVAVVSNVPPLKVRPEVASPRPASLAMITVGPVPPPLELGAPMVVPPV